MFLKINLIIILLFCVLSDSLSQSIISLDKIEELAEEYCRDFNIEINHNEGLVSKKVIYIKVANLNHDSLALLICAVYNNHIIDSNQVDYFAYFKQSLLVFNFINCDITDIISTDDTKNLIRYNSTHQELIKKHLLPVTVIAAGAIIPRIILINKHNMTITDVFTFIDVSVITDDFEQLKIIH